MPQPTNPQACRASAPAPALLALLLLAGCAGPPTNLQAETADAPAPSVTGTGGRDLRTQLRETDELPAPTWQIGERFRHHVFFGTDDTEGQHYDTIVVETLPDAYILATDDQQVAKEDAVIDIPILGDIRGSDLTMSGFGSPWDLYEFPLRHNATWDVTFPNLAWDSIPTATVDLQVRARYVAEISTPDGPRPGFQLQAYTPDNQLIADYDYVPAIGWFAHFTIYDIDEGQDSIEFRVASMGHDYDWTGTYYRTEAVQLLQRMSGNVIDPDNPTSPVLMPAPPATFTVTADSQYVFGLVGAIAVAGANEIVIVTPGREVHHWETLGAPVGGMHVLWEVPAEAGEWQVIAAGAGAVALAYLELYEIFERPQTL